MSYLQVQELFEQLYAVYRSLGDNFMEESGLVLSPEYIFYDFSAKKYTGLYYPDYETDRPYEALMDFLLEHLDEQDERLAACIYQIYERTQESGFSLPDALQILGRAEESGKATIKEKEEIMETIPAEKENIFLTSDNTEKDGEDMIPLSFSSEKPDLQEKKGKESGKKTSVFYPFLMVLSVFGMLGSGYIYFSFALSEEEVIILFGCAALMGVCFLAGLAGTCGRGKKRKDTGKEEEILMPGEEYFSADDNIPIEQVLDRTAALSSTVPKENEEETYCAEPAECGNTVFFDSEKLVEYKLYALDKKNKKHIELKQFPCTVGKMAGCVDCVLMDDSVSRIHAKFEKAENVVLMTDMNSTNGTYKNGLRLQPQETVEIEPGDEIRFGNLNYCYR